MKWKALLIGVISYPILWFVWFFLSPQYEHHSLHSYSMVMYIMYWLLPVFSGMLAAKFAKSDGFKHALVVGIILGGISVLVWYYLGILESNMLLNLASIVILAAVGGALVQAISSFIVKRKPVEKTTNDLA